MLRITIRRDADTTTICLEGRLVTPWVFELDRCWRTMRTEEGAKRVQVDLNDVIYIGSEGKELLSWMHQGGVELIAAGFQAKSIVQEIVGGGPFNRSS